MYESPIEITTYESPINYYIDRVVTHLKDETDKTVLKAVARVDVHVDKDELVKALEYDRDQYMKGFRDGKMETLNSLVRCKDCKHRPRRGKNKWANVCAPRVMASEYEQHRTVEDETCPFLCDDPFYSEMPPDDFFCAYGEVKDEL